MYMTAPHGEQLTDQPQDTMWFLGGDESEYYGRHGADLAAIVEQIRDLGLITPYKATELSKIHTPNDLLGIDFAVNGLASRLPEADRYGSYVHRANKVTEQSFPDERIRISEVHRRQFEGDHALGVYTVSRVIGTVAELVQIYADKGTVVSAEAFCQPADTPVWRAAKKGFPFEEIGQVGTLLCGEVDRGEIVPCVEQIFRSWLVNYTGESEFDGVTKKEVANARFSFISAQTLTEYADKARDSRRYRSIAGNGTPPTPATIRWLARDLSSI